MINTYLYIHIYICIYTPIYICMYSLFIGNEQFPRRSALGLRNQSRLGIRVLLRRILSFRNKRCTSTVMLEAEEQLVMGFRENTVVLRGKLCLEQVRQPSTGINSMADIQYLTYAAWHEEGPKHYNISEPEVWRPDVCNVGKDTWSLLLLQRDAPVSVMLVVPRSFLNFFFTIHAFHISLRGLFPFLWCRIFYYSGISTSDVESVQLLCNYCNTSYLFFDCSRLTM